MKFLLTNTTRKESNLVKDIFIIYYNPWGFSKKSIEHQVETALSSFDINDNDILYIYMKPHFFGKRSEIVVKFCQKNIKAQILVLSDDNFELLINDSSV